MRPSLPSSLSPLSPDLLAAVRGKQGWHGAHRGGAAVVAIGTSLMHWTGWRLVYLLVFLGAAVYWLVDRNARRESLRYWRHARPDGSYLDHVCWSYQHLVRYGRIQLDRQLFYCDAFSYSGSGLEPLRQYLQSGQGCILLSAHMGNWELSAARLNAISKGRTAIVRVIEDSARVRQLIANHMRDQQPEIIDPRDFMGASLRIRSALTEGRLVCMLGDRQLDGQSAVRVPFLGGYASFSSGPFLVAGLTGAPIYVGFFLKRGRTHYHVSMDAPYYVHLPKKGHARQQALTREVAAWARRLEHEVHRHPVQWHNFFNFWQD